MTATKQRIDFIDLAKGVCILLLAIGHCGINTGIPGYIWVAVPLFFVISGLFFKNYDKLRDMWINKINRLLIPFFFFYFTAYLCFYALKWFMPNMLVTASEGICDIFYNRQFFNGPIWFILCLFWCNILFGIICRYVSAEWQRIAIVIAMGAVGWYLGYCDVILPMFIDVALTALPFFAFGYYLKRLNILQDNKSRVCNLLIAIVLWGGSLALEQFTDTRLSMHYNKIEGWATWPVSLISVVSMIYLCKAVRSLPFITYVGRYSIVILCVHHMIYRPLIVLFSRIPMPEAISTAWLVALVTILISALCIPIFKRYLPWAIAQKDLLVIKDK